MNDRLCEKLKKLHAVIGSDNAAEREAARLKITELLAKNKKTWNDLPELLSAATTQGAQDDPDVQSGDSAAGDSRPAPLDLIRHILQRHLHLTEHQFVAMLARGSTCSALSSGNERTRLPPSAAIACNRGRVILCPPAGQSARGAPLPHRQAF